MPRNIVWIIPMLGLLLFFGFAANAAEGTVNPYRILLLSSYEPTHRYTNEFLHELRDCLIPEQRFQWNTLFLSGENPATEKEILRTLRENRYDAVLCLFDSSIKFLKKNKNELPAGTPLLVFTRNMLESEVRETFPESTGILGQDRILENLNFGRKLFPNAVEILILHDDSSGINSGFAFSDRNVRLSFEYANQTSEEQILDKIRKLPEHSFVVCGFSRNLYRKKKENSFGNLKTIIEKSERPCLTIQNNFIAGHAVGGIISEAEANAAILADLIRKTANGIPASALPCERERTHCFLNYPTLSRFAANLRNIPGNTSYINRTVKDEPPRRGNILLTVFVLLTALFLAFAGWAVYSLKVLHKKKKKLIILLKKAVRAKQSAVSAKNFFLAGMSHEIRTPLNSVIGCSSLLLTRELPREEISGHVKAINASGHTLMSLFNDLFLFYRLESSGSKEEKIKTNIRTLCAGIVETLKASAADKHLELTMSCPSAIPALYLEESSIRQILLNILGNAVRYTNYGKIGLKVNFIIKMDGMSGNLNIEISDTGPGIPEEIQTYLYEPYSQKGHFKGTRGEYTGSGLGLPIAKRLLDRIGGSLELKTAAGKGTVFTLKFPKIKCEQRSLDDKTVLGPKLSSDTESLEKIVTVLVVDDVELNTKVLSRLLERLGCICKCANSGKEALEVLKHFHPNVILTDLWMPDMSGEQFAREVRKKEEWKNIRIIAVTANAEVQELKDRSVFEEIMLKPVDKSVLKKLLEKSIPKVP